MIYLYAITEPDAPVPDCAGQEEAPVRRLRAGRVAGLYSRHEREHLDPEAETLWRHDQVVEAAMASGPVLPARFGTAFADEAALATALERDQEQLAERLDSVRGCVELAVRVSLPATESAPPQGGREYLSAQLASQRQRQAVAEQTLIPLAALAVRSHSRTGDPRAGTLTASYLVRAGEVEGFAERVRGLASRHTELSLSCTGPWPPYSFVGGDA